MKKQKTREAVAGYLFILPSSVLILLFSVIPILMTFYLSCTKYNVFQKPQWIGLENYIRMFHDPFIPASLVNTIFYAVITVPLQTVISLVIASIISAFFRNHFGGFLRSALFVPVISSAILVGTIFSFLLATDGGIVNLVLGVLKIPKINWLGNTSTSLISVASAGIWKNVGYFLVIFYAGIMEVPKDLYEAARVDGASSVQQFFHITLPQLKPITLLVVILGTIWSFQVFDMVYVMTGGGPGLSTTTLVLTIYNTAFKQYSMGYSSAVGVLLFVIVVMISAVQKFAFRNQKGE